MDQIQDRWVRIGGVAVLLLPLIVNGMTSTGQRGFWDEFIYVAMYLLSVVLILESGRLLILRFHKKFAEPELGKKRFWGACFAVFASNVVIILLTFYLSHWVRGMRGNREPRFLMAVGIAGIVLAMVQAGIYEGLYYFTRLRRLEQEKEELLRMNLQSRYDSLKQQVNPHFLFNSINTVSSLIDKDSTKAKKYLSEMSKVYRYLLQANEEELATLRAELQFIDSYYHLLKTRFADGLELEIDVPEPYMQYSLPALTLQLLMENAVKHNIVDREKPLAIRITVLENGMLGVSNNLQKRINVVPSTKLGLSNIMAKYKLLNNREVIVRETMDEFTVALPLIKNLQA